MARNDDMETYLKLKLPTLENENKALKTKFQKTKEKNFELVCSYSYMHSELLYSNVATICECLYKNPL